MRDNSGRNYKIAVNCLVCILDYILIQMRKVNGEKGYRFISIVSMTFFLKLRKVSLSVSYALSVVLLAQMSCQMFYFFDLFFFFFSVNHGIQVGVGINFL